MIAPTFDLAGKKVWVAGHNGMAGGAIARRLGSENCEILTVDRATLDLRRQEPVEKWVSEHRPDVVVVAAAVVGGIQANNTFPVDFLCDNLLIETNIMRASADIGVKKLLFLGSSCLYPGAAPQPMKEDALLTGPPEPTNQWYSVAKIAGVKLCQAYRRQFGLDFISIIPTNLYGPGDNYHPEHSHVPAALIRRMHEAKLENLPQVSIWGTGEPRREFMFVDDLADACIFLLKNYSDESTLNVGLGADVSIADFARAVAAAVGYKGELVFDISKPDGARRKLLDVSRLSAMGWTAGTDLGSGLKLAYQDFLAGGRRVRTGNSSQ